MTILTFVLKFRPPAALNYLTMTSIILSSRIKYYVILPLETKRLELMPDKVWLLITAGGGPKSDTNDVFRGLVYDNSRIS